MPIGLNFRGILPAVLTNVPHRQGEEEPNDTYITQLVGEYRSPEGGGCTTHITCTLC